MKIEKLQEELFALNRTITLLLDETEYKANDQLLNLEFNSTEPTDLMLYDTFLNLFTHLDYINLILTYLQNPIKAEGWITVNQQGKYKINGILINENDCIEILRNNDENVYWDLVIVGNKSSLKNKYARIR